MRSRATVAGRLAAPTKLQRYAIFVAVMLALTGGAIAIVLSGNRTERDIAIGVISSFVASLIILGATILIENDETRTAVASFEDTVKALAARAPLLHQADKHGVQAIKPKSLYNDDEWIALLTHAREELFFVGHALDKWCNREPVKRHFSETIVRLASAGKPVRLVALPPEGEVTAKLGDQREKVYPKRINHTMGVLAAIRKQIPKDQRLNLQVMHLREDVTMPYMIVGNEHTLITASYPTGTEDSNNMPAVTVDSQQALGIALRSDMEWLVTHHCTAHKWT
ncbi:MAG: hypothetical protein QOJ29_1065 [Thermoleophilaceae bacterium]|jgi:hypothetical protein|nr:hypothetical protein [Thermoleophilaceae bacterium]